MIRLNFVKRVLCYYNNCHAFEEDAEMYAAVNQLVPDLSNDAKT